MVILLCKGGIMIRNCDRIAICFEKGTTATIALTEEQPPLTEEQPLDKG